MTVIAVGERSFTDCNHGHVDFNSTAGYGAGSMNLTRLTQPADLKCPMISCRSAFPRYMMVVLTWPRSIEYLHVPGADVIDS